LSVTRTRRNARIGVNSMKKLTYTYVDNSNFFIEGQRVAAVEAGMALHTRSSPFLSSNTAGRFLGE
jgi:hypothetical protein